MRLFKRKEPTPEAQERRLKHAYIGLRKLGYTEEELAYVVKAAEFDYRFVHDLARMPGHE